MSSMCDGMTKIYTSKCRAFTERMHQHVRTKLWGYASDGIDCRGIRPTHRNYEISFLFFQDQRSPIAYVFFKSLIFGDTSGGESPLQRDETTVRVAMGCCRSYVTTHWHWWGILPDATKSPVLQIPVSDCRGLTDSFPHLVECEDPYVMPIQKRLSVCAVLIVVPQPQNGSNTKLPGLLEAWIILPGLRVTCVKEGWKNKVCRGAGSQQRILPCCRVH